MVEMIEVDIGIAIEALNSDRVNFYRAQRKDMFGTTAAKASNHKDQWYNH